MVRGPHAQPGLGLLVQVADSNACHGCHENAINECIVSNDFFDGQRGRFRVGQRLRDESDLGVLRRSLLILMHDLSGDQTR